jgi:hypothetical protein
LEINLELLNQYPDVYSTFLNNADPQKTTAGITGLGGVDS